MKNILMWIVCKALGDGCDNICDLMYKWFEMYDAEDLERRISWKNGDRFDMKITYDKSKK